MKNRLKYTGSAGMIAIIVMIAAWCVPAADAQDILGKEPDAAMLGAPRYPTAVFLRTMNSLDPYFESAFYVVPEPVIDVKNWIAEQMPGMRIVQYRDEFEWVWTFLLGNIPFPDKPAGDDTVLLDKTPNVLVKKYQGDLYEPLIELLESTPGQEKRLAALKDAKTVIRYTYRIVEENYSFNNIIGTWKDVDRDLEAYRGMTITFRPDSTYTITLTDDNIATHAGMLALKPGAANKNPRDIARAITAKNPENGRFSVRRNNIDMETDTPVFGDKVKSGLTEVGRFSFVVQFINMPRLTFIRDRSTDTGKK